jgi:hypothetical protein
MPVAVSNTTETETFDLKSAPPDGFVELRRMTYGQVVQRRAMMKLSVETSGKSKDFKGEMAMASHQITIFEFKNCIVNHNLEKTDGVKLQLGNPVDFDSLDPRVGQEIEKYIGEMNNFEDDDSGD